MKKPGTQPLKWQMLGIMLGCWLVPVILILWAMSWYISTAFNGQTAEAQTESLAEQFAANMQMCADRVEGAAQASRIASYDTTITDAWEDYADGGLYMTLYRSTKSFIDLQYRSDNRFRFAVLWFDEDPENMVVYTQIEKSGVRADNVIQCIDRDGQAVIEIARELDTGLAFAEMGGEVYMIRNIVDRSYKTVATLVMSLNIPYYFESLQTLPWSEELTVTLGDARLNIKGSGMHTAGELGLDPDSSGYICDGWENSWIQSVQKTGSYTMSALVKADYSSVTEQSRSYKYVLLGMFILLVPLVILVLVFFRSRISRPIERLMQGASEIENGKLGYQLEDGATSREFMILTDSFNHMSGQLQSQFDRLYQEELALRDARIKALQSHINPHFLNNTLEIINWQARMSGDAKVSQMIEALTTVMDAVIARDKRSEVTLAEEMGYINAYLYIISERFGRRLTITKDIDESVLDCMVPRLILQPVLENAVEHGISPGGKASIAIRGFMEGVALILEVENDGSLTEEDAEKIARLLSPEYDANSGADRNLGIANVNSRLKIMRGGNSGLTIKQGGDNQVIARLVIEPRAEPTFL